METDDDGQCNKKVMKTGNDFLKLKRLDWYIIKKFLGTYLFMIALIISIAVVFDINEKIDKFMTEQRFTA